MSKINETIFTKIAKGDIPSFKLGENENAFAFLDINPLMPGHALVIPKVAYPTLMDTPDDVLADVIRLTKEVATKIKEKLNADGVNIQSSNGVEANQDIEHLHFHIVPRFKTENLDIWEGIKKADDIEESIEDIYKRII
ncbi:MAG: HIT domain-containing protein [Candidatus Dojkabacteria bacterium]|nr:HIT domain-containing protein [Candidatus Dojkabacteria bacterium]MDQ7021246.1 HIT domain-containing protein [Candidatus Dojkabacteria bacterium]